jgi:hypothetical protein
MPFKDPEKRRAYRRKWYQNNKKSERAHIKRRKLEIKSWFKELKSGLYCMKCKENHPATLEFHHKDVNKKEKTIGLMIRDGFSIERISLEIKKCMVLCANCHRKVHYLERKNLKKEQNS